MNQSYMINLIETRKEAKMDQHIEIEYKNLLAKQDFERLLHFFKIEQKQFFTQKNHYFDTKEFDLKGQASALRIREKNGTYELTLKQPAVEGKLESNQMITKEEAEGFLKDGRFPAGAVQAIIQEAGLNPQEFSCFGTLQTDRAELEYRGGLIVLDHSFYEGKEDYELEYEVEDPQAGKKIFVELLESLNIPLQKTENKVKRFYKARFGE